MIARTQNRRPAAQTDCWPSGHRREWSASPLAVQQGLKARLNGQTKGHRHGQNKSARALQITVRLNVHKHKGRQPRRALRHRPRPTGGCACFNACRHTDRRELLNMARAITGRAGVGDNLAGSVAGMAGRSTMKKPCCAPPPCPAHVLRCCARPDPRHAPRRRPPRRQIDLALGAVKGIFQRDADLGAQSVPRRCWRRPATPAPAAEKFFENIARTEIAKFKSRRRLAPGPLRLQSGMAELVIGRAALRVFQHVIGFGNLFEFALASASPD